MKQEQKAIKSVNIEIKCQIRSGVYHSLYIYNVGKVSHARVNVQSGIYYNMYIYLCSVCHINIIFQFCYQLCQRTLIATCNRRIPYYVYHICQSKSMLLKSIEKTLSMF